MEAIVKYGSHLHLTKQPRKAEFLEKEVLQLTGGLVPAKVVRKSHFEGPVASWVQIPINGPAQGDLHVWAKQEDADKGYEGAKFNTPVDMVIPPSFEPFETSQWTTGETAYLFEMLQKFSMNFIVVADRYSYAGTERDVESLKERYFAVARQHLEREGVDHPLRNFEFDAEAQRFRKKQLEKTFLRGKDVSEQERSILEELKKLEATIRKEEREHAALRKILKLDEQAPEEDCNLPQEKPGSEHAVYSRGNIMQKGLPLPKKVSEKLVEVLAGLGFGDKVLGLARHQALFDRLRRQVLAMFSLQKAVRKKEHEKKLLDEKKKTGGEERRAQDSKRRQR